MPEHACDDGTSKSMNTIAVIGAGVMGAGIAAHAANAGAKVLLFDLVPDDIKAGMARNHIAAHAIKTMGKANPSVLTHPSHAQRITPLNLEDDLAYLADCDWVIEAIIENLPLKQALYDKILPYLKADAMLSSNTSTISLNKLSETLSPNDQARFCITHFFNPPRYMNLLELVTQKGSQHSNHHARLHEFIDKKMGKTIIYCHDRPGFIANRLGIYWILTGLQEAIEHDLTVEAADMMISKPFGIPKTGIFGLMDLVGIDLLPKVLHSMLDNLDGQDKLVQEVTSLPLIEDMLKQNLVGRKGKGGFYAMEKSKDGGRTLLALDWKSLTYRAKHKPNLAAGKFTPQEIKALFALKDNVEADFARKAMLRCFAYATYLLGDASDDVAAIDAAMRLGYRWQYGPFQLMDMLGMDSLIDHFNAYAIDYPDWLLNMAGQGFYQIKENREKRAIWDGKITHHPMVLEKGKLNLRQFKLGQVPNLHNDSASLWDIGDGVACFEMTSHMNSFDPGVLGLLQQTIDEWSKLNFRALVIYNEGACFSAGANLALVSQWFKQKDIKSLTDFIHQGQHCFRSLKYAPFPVVGAVQQIALGGGCELLLHCDTIQAHIESYIGLVEVGVGIIPAWGGCAQMLSRFHQNPSMPKGVMPTLSKAFEMIASAKTSPSAVMAKQMGVLRPHDDISMNLSSLLFDAKKKALSLAASYRPPEKVKFAPAGPSGMAALTMGVQHYQRMGQLSRYDETIAACLIECLCGGVDADPTQPIDEDDVMELEKAAIMKLMHNPQTLERIDHMLATGKALRN